MSDIILVEQNQSSLFVNNCLLIHFRGRILLLYFLFARVRERERESKKLAVNTHKIQIFHPEASSKSSRSRSGVPKLHCRLLPSLLSLSNLIQHRTPILGGETSFLTALGRKLKLPMKEQHISFLWRAGNLSYASKVFELFFFHTKIPQKRRAS